jgi:hypothetical protein
MRLTALAATIVLLVVVFDLVRRRRLLERYALVWMGVTGILLVLSAWDGLLTWAAELIGVVYPPSAFFAIAIGFVTVLLLHFSVAVSRLTDQSKVLAQRVAALEERLRRQESRDAALEELDAAAAARASAAGTPSATAPSSTQ